MNNETIKTPVDFLREQYYESEGKLTRNDFEQAKQIEKEKMIEFAQEVFRNRYNQISQSLGNIADDIYHETYGGTK